MGSRHARKTFVCSRANSFARLCTYSLRVPFVVPLSFSSCLSPSLPPSLPLPSFVPWGPPFFEQKHNWVPRRKQDKAKTLDDIRKEAEAEARGGGAPPG